MVKMGMDIDETRNHRIRGIIPTEDNKYVFIEILEGNKPNIKYTNLSKKEYEKKYPYDEYIWIDGCFRVDIPKDKFHNISPEYVNYHSASYHNLQHTKENIVKLLKEFNKNIVDIDLVDDYYLDKFCEENGFFRLYDNRLDHKQEALKVNYYNSKQIQFKEKYSCYNYDHSVLYEEERTERYNDYDINDLYQIYGEDNLNKLIDDYKNELKEIFEEKEM